MKDDMLMYLHMRIEQLTYLLYSVARKQH